MSIIVKSDDLKAVMDRVIRDIDPKSTMSVLSGMLLQASKEGLRVIGSDITTTARYKIPAAVDAPASAVIRSPRKLIKWIKARKNNEAVEIEFDKDLDTVTFRRAGRSLSLGLIPIDDFPVVEFDKKWIGVGQIQASEFAKWAVLLTQTMDPEEFRSYLHGTIFDNNKIFSSDGCRVNILRYNNIKVDERFIIPAPAWKRISEEMNRKGATDSVVFEISEPIEKEIQYARVTFDDHDRVIRLPDTEPPDIELVIPRSNEIEFRPDVEEFRQAIKEVASIVTKRDRTLYLNPSNSGMQVEYKVPGEEIEYEAIVPGAWTVPKDKKAARCGFNYKFLEEALAPFDKPVLKFSTDPLDGILIIQDDHPLTVVVMPVRR